MKFVPHGLPHLFLKVVEGNFRRDIEKDLEA